MMKIEAHGDGTGPIDRSMPQVILAIISVYSNVAVLWDAFAVRDCNLHGHMVPLRSDV